VGYDDVPMAAWPAYGLTTIRQPVNRMVEATVAALLDQIEGGSPAPTKVKINGPLMVRTSARIPEGWKE
jgi:DNA-binding LacI/PurR family transcriptional regulator